MGAAETYEAARAADPSATGHADLPMASKARSTTDVFPGFSTFRCVRNDYGTLGDSD